MAKSLRIILRIMKSANIERSVSSIDCFLIDAADTAAKGADTD